VILDFSFWIHDGFEKMFGEAVMLHKSDKVPAATADFWSRLRRFLPIQNPKSKMTGNADSHIVKASVRFRQEMPGTHSLLCL